MQQFYKALVNIFENFKSNKYDKNTRIQEYKNENILFI